MGGVATSIAALGNGVGDGDMGVIRVTQDAESFQLPLTWDAAASKWVSTVQPHEAIVSNDGDWLAPIQAGTNPTWEYVGAPHSEVAWSGLKGGAIMFAGALFAAGLKLQDRISCSSRDDGGGTKNYLAAWFFEFSDNQSVIFDNDASAFSGKTWNGVNANTIGFFPSSANVGHGAVAASSGAGVTREYISTGTYEDNITTSGYHGVSRNAGWDYVKFFTATQPSGAALGGVPTSTPYTPTKKYLYPTLYGYGPQTLSEGWANVSWECRWTS